MTGARAALLVCAAALAGAALAQAPQLETYESNAIGWTQDSDDVGFLDVQLSLKFPLLPQTISPVLHDTRLYFAATVRFGQYLETRESSPVVGKRFNPKLIWRQITRWDDASTAAGRSCRRGADPQGCEYFDFAYAHESNGQSINSEAEFRVAQEVERFPEGRAEFAKDYISRGWDYLELAARHWAPPALGSPRLDASFRLFLRDGLMQGPAEEYNDWEQDPEGKPRRRVHGLAVLATWHFNPARQARATVRYETGYSQPFRHNTVRVEAAATFVELPFMVFYQNGYANDLALYYKRASSWGIALEVAAF
jgi:hypothetical protein